MKKKLIIIVFLTMIFSLGCSHTLPAEQAKLDGILYYKVKPKYPREAFNSKTEGSVEFLVDVLDDGSVSNIRVVDGLNLDIFEESARRSVAQWKYRPFTDESGKPIKKIDYKVKIDFKFHPR